MTVTVAPVSDVASSIEHAVAPLRQVTVVVVDPALMSVLIAVVTELVTAAVLPPREATRAPSRAALEAVLCELMSRPKSMMPNTSRNRIGAISANSTAAAPRSPRARRTARRVSVIATSPPSAQVPW